MKLESWKGLALLLSLSYIIAMIAGVILCNIKSCSQAQISGTFLQPLWLFSIIAWFILRGKRKEEK